MFQQLMQRLGAKAQGDGKADLAAALAQATGGQIMQPQPGIMQQLMQSAAAKVQAQQAQQAPLMPQQAPTQSQALMGSGTPRMDAPQAQPQGGNESLVAAFRQVFGRDPMNQQELGLLNLPFVSQLVNQVG